MNRPSAKLALRIAVPALLMQPACAQADESETQFWTDVSGDFLLAPEVPASLSLATRFRDSSRGRDQSLLRANAEHAFSRNFSSGILLSFERNSTTYEARPWQQLAIGLHGFTLRTRVEERLVEGADRAEIRVRPRLQYGTRLKDFYILSSAEWTYRLQSRLRQDHGKADYGRFSASLRHPLGHDLEGAATYMVMYKPNGGGPAVITHIPQISISRRF